MPFESSWLFVGYLLTFGTAALASGIAAIPCSAAERRAVNPRGSVGLCRAGPYTRQ
jgi:hypothetical protein